MINVNAITMTTTEAFEYLLSHPEIINKITTPATAAHLRHRYYTKGTTRPDTMKRWLELAGFGHKEEWTLPKTKKAK